MSGSLLLRGWIVIQRSLCRRGPCRDGQVIPVAYRVLATSPAVTFVVVYCGSHHPMITALVMRDVQGYGWWRSRGLIGSDARDGVAPPPGSRTGEMIVSPEGAVAAVGLVLV